MDGRADARRVVGEGLTRGLLVCEIRLARRAEGQRKVPREQDRPLALALRGNPTARSGKIEDLCETPFMSINATPCCPPVTYLRAARSRVFPRRTRVAR